MAPAPFGSCVVPLSPACQSRINRCRRTRRRYGHDYAASRAYSGSRAEFSQSARRSIGSFMSDRTISGGVE